MGEGERYPGGAGTWFRRGLGRHVRGVVLPGDRDPGGLDGLGVRRRTARIAPGHHRAGSRREDRGRTGTGSGDAYDVDPFPGPDRTGGPGGREAGPDRAGHSPTRSSASSSAPSPT